MKDEIVKIYIILLTNNTLWNSQNFLLERRFDGKICFFKHHYFNMKDQEGTMDFDQVTSLSLSQNAFDYRYVSGYCTLKMPQATSLP